MSPRQLLIGSKLGSPELCCMAAVPVRLSGHTISQFKPRTATHRVSNRQLETIRNGRNPFKIKQITFSNRPKISGFQQPPPSHFVPPRPPAPSRPDRPPVLQSL